MFYDRRQLVNETIYNHEAPKPKVESYSTCSTNQSMAEQNEHNVDPKQFVKLLQIQIIKNITRESEICPSPEAYIYRPMNNGTQPDATFSTNQSMAPVTRTSVQNEHNESQIEFVHLAQTQITKNVTREHEICQSPDACIYHSMNTSSQFLTFAYTNAVLDVAQANPELTAETVINFVTPEPFEQDPDPITLSDEFRIGRFIATTLTSLLCRSLVSLYV